MLHIYVPVCIVTEIYYAFINCILFSKLVQYDTTIMIKICNLSIWKKSTEKTVPYTNKFWCAINVLVVHWDGIL